MGTPETSGTPEMSKTPETSDLSGALAGILSFNIGRVLYDYEEKKNLMSSLIEVLEQYFTVNNGGYLELKGDDIKNGRIIGDIECCRGNPENNKGSNFFIFKGIEGSRLSVGYCIRKIPPDLNETDNGSYNPNNHPYKFEVLKASRSGENYEIKNPPVGKIEYYNGDFKLG